MTQPRAADDFATIRAAWRSCAGSARQGTLRKASCGLSRRVMVEPISALPQRSALGRDGVRQSELRVQLNRDRAWSARRE